MSTVAEMLNGLFDKFTHLPNCTPCQGCGGEGRRANVRALTRWVLGLPDDPAETEPCPACNADGARRCDYGCTRLATRYALGVGRMVCGLCDPATPTPPGCCECTWGQPDEVELGDGASFRCSYVHRLCGRGCCSEACAAAHELKCTTPAEEPC